jgi:DNA replication protein DnaC
MTTENPIKSVGEIASEINAALPRGVMRVPITHRLTWDQILADIPPEYRDATPNAILSAAMVSTGASIMLHGKPGTGKTYQAYALLVADRRKRGVMLVEAGETVYVGLPLDSWCREKADALRSRDQVRIITEAGDIRANRYDHRWLAKVAEYRGTLVVDDIGFTKPTEWVTEAVYHLANERRAWRLRTIWTTNLTPEELRDAFSPAIASRLSGGAVVELTGRDRRVSS